MGLIEALREELGGGRVLDGRDWIGGMRDGLRDAVVCAAANSLAAAGAAPGDGEAILALVRERLDAAHSHDEPLPRHLELLDLCLFAANAANDLARGDG